MQVKEGLNAGINVSARVKNVGVKSPVLIGVGILMATAGDTRITMFNRYRRYPLNQEG